MPSRDVEYWSGYEGKHTHVIKTEDAVRAILCRHKNDLDRIDRLEEENKKLKDEVWKDEELQDMKTRLDKMQADYNRGFPIDEYEWEAIKKWCKEHEEKVHNGRHMSYSYHFVPTPLGDSGIIKCAACNKEFEFKKIG